MFCVLADQHIFDLILLVLSNIKPYDNITMRSPKPLKIQDDVKYLRSFDTQSYSHVLAY